MSARNGDKSRYGRQRRKKILQRLRNRALAGSAQQPASRKA